MVIVGNGCAGAECIKALRQSGYRGKIHLLTDSRWPISIPMLTTYYVAGKIGFEGLFPYGAGQEFYLKYGVDVYPESPVVALDAEQMTGRVLAAPVPAEIAAKFDPATIVEFYSR